MIALIDYNMGNLFSVTQAFKYCGETPRIVTDAAELMKFDAAVLPGVGNFGEGMLRLRESGLAEKVIEFAGTGRPLLGICLGMQMAIVEFARHVLDIRDAHSIELDPQTAHPVIHLMPDQNGVTDIGGTLRLGSYPCILGKDTKAYQLYGTEKIAERHRHRYEVNNDYRAALTAHGMTLSGISPDGRIVEMVELPNHPWFIGTQAHPELKSRPNRPHPLFKGFIGAALEYQKNQSEQN